MVAQIEPGVKVIHLMFFSQIRHSVTTLGDPWVSSAPLPKDT